MSGGDSSFDAQRAGWRKLSAADYLLGGIVSLICALALQVWQARIDLNLGDEGLLWYDVQRTLAGELPIRDFQPYDAGRYFFYAAWAKLFHSDGIVALRCGGAVVQWAAMMGAMALLLRVLPSRWLAAGFGFAAALWMAPRHKLFDVAATVWMTYFLAWLIARPTPRRHLLAGVQIGLLWWIGRNHLLYAGVAAVVIVAAMALSDRIGWRTLAKRVGSGFGGVILGAAPMLLMLLAARGYARAYWENAIVRLAEHGTNLPLAVPWPWRGAGGWQGFGGFCQWAIGVGFVLSPAAVLAGGIVLAVRYRRGQSLEGQAILLAATVCGAVEAHHIFSRADLPHLAQAGWPLVLTLAALPGAAAGWGRWIFRAVGWGALAVVTAGAMPLLCPRVEAWLRPGADYEWATVGGERLYLPAYTRRVCAAAGDVVRQMGAGETAIFVPYVPGLYAVFRLRCPMEEAYPVLPETPGRQEKIIADLDRHRTDWALVWPDRIDGRADLGFDRTHAMVYAYLRRNFQLMATDDPAGGVEILRRQPGH